MCVYAGVKLSQKMNVRIIIFNNKHLRVMYNRK